MGIKIFLDSDVVIDHFTKRMPFSVETLKIFELHDLGLLRIHVSAVSINNIYYIVRQVHDKTETLLLIDELIEKASVLGTTKKEIRDALDSNFSDFEDGVQHATAITFGNIDCIVTRNIADYKNSLLPAYTPESFLQKFEFQN